MPVEPVNVRAGASKMMAKHGVPAELWRRCNHRHQTIRPSGLYQLNGVTQAAGLWRAVKG
jgi:hypothetical protein